MMRTKLMGVAMLLIGVLLAGCASMGEAMPWTKSALRGALIAPEEAERMRRTAGNKLVGELLDARAEAKLPTTVALAKVAGSGSGQAYLQAVEAEELRQWEALVADEKQLLGVQPVPSLAVRTEGDSGAVSLRGLREASGRIGCELLLVYLQDDRVEQRENAAAGLYWTVLGLWLAEGHDLEAETTMQGLLVDARTGKVLGSAVAQKQVDGQATAAAVEARRRALRKQAEAGARKDLHARMGVALKRVAARGVVRTALP